MSDLHFFATRDDLLPLLLEVESNLEFEYVRAGEVESEIEAWTEAAEIPDLGRAVHGDQVLEPCYLVVPNSDSVVVETRTPRAGPARRTVDMAENPASVMLRAGGVHRPDVVIAGQLGTITWNRWAENAFRVFAAAIQTRFEKVRSYLVGERAGALLRSGARLPSSVRSPAEYDLRL